MTSIQYPETRPVGTRRDGVLNTAVNRDGEDNFVHIGVLTRRIIDDLRVKLGK